MKKSQMIAVFLACLPVCGCAGNSSKVSYFESYEKAIWTPMPSWVENNAVDAKKVCGIGVAGRTFYAASDQAKELGLERAIENLAGIFETKVHKALVSESRSNNQSFYKNVTSVQYRADLEVSEDLMSRLLDLVTVDFWYDVKGEGPFAQTGFTYARACVDYKTMSNMTNIDKDVLEKSQGEEFSLSPRKVPAWINRYAKWGNRYCAVGYAQPRFYPEETLDAVVEDIRGQLVADVRGWITNYYEQNNKDDWQSSYSLLTSITDAISQGVVVTNFWYDRDGIGTYKQKRTTYGWGCVYPVSILAKSSQALSRQHPQEAKTIEDVRQHAQAAFDALEDEIDKHQEQ